MDKRVKSLAERLVAFNQAIHCEGPRAKLYRIEVSPVAAQALTRFGDSLSWPIRPLVGTYTHIPTNQGVHDCGTIYGVGLTVRVDKCDKRVTHPIYPEQILYCDRPAMHEGDHHFECSFKVS